MAIFTYQEIFGSNVTVSSQPGFPLELLISMGDFREDTNGGELPYGVGLIDADDPTATRIFYGLIMMLLKNQPARIDTDPIQRVYVTDAGKSIATGARDGQVKRSFTVSFFIDAGLAGTPGMEQIDV